VYLNHREYRENIAQREKRKRGLAVFSLTPPPALGEVYLNHREHRENIAQREKRKRGWLYFLLYLLLWARCI
jgi:hypothetical protein